MKEKWEVKLDIEIKQNDPSHIHQVTEMERNLVDKRHSAGRWKVSSWTNVINVEERVDYLI